MQPKSFGRANLCKYLHQSRRKRNATKVFRQSQFMQKAQGELKRSIPMKVASWGLLEERRSADPLSALICVGSSISPVPIVDDLELFSIVEESPACDASRIDASGSRSSRHLHWREELTARHPMRSDDVWIILTPTVFDGAAGGGAQSRRTPCPAPAVQMSRMSRCLLITCWLRCFVTKSAGLVRPCTLCNVSSVPLSSCWSHK